MPRPWERKSDQPVQGLSSSSTASTIRCRTTPFRRPNRSSRPILCSMRAADRGRSKWRIASAQAKFSPSSPFRSHTSTAVVRGAMKAAKLSSSSSAPSPASRSTSQSPRHLPRAAWKPRAPSTEDAKATIFGCGRSPASCGRAGRRSRMRSCNCPHPRPRRSRQPGRGSPTRRQTSYAGPRQTATR